MKVISITALLAYSVFADAIYLKNGDKIENAMLTEITQTDIKYKIEGRAVVYTISKDSTTKVIYNDGSEDIFPLLKQPILEDSRDGKIYKTVEMPDGKIWMAENLNYEIGKSECYDNNKNYCDYCGRLYNWKTAMEACPVGWHLPTDAEWSNLKTASGGKVAGTALKSKSSWNKDGNGRDDYGFSVLACGYRDPYIFFQGDHIQYGYRTIFWSATDDEYIAAINVRYFRANNANVKNIGSTNSALYSVRCVKDDTLKTPEPLVEQVGDIGYQKIWDMHHIRLSTEWFYETIGFGIRNFSYKEYNPKYVEFEIIVGYVHRWMVTQPDNFIRTNFGLFGGLGYRLSLLYSDDDFCHDNDNRNYCKQDYINMRHELGAELVLGNVSLYIAERNFHRIGGGIGLAFWRPQ